MKVINIIKILIFLKSNYFTYEFGNCKRIINMIFKILGEEENAVEEKYNI